MPRERPHVIGVTGITVDPIGLRNHDALVRKERELVRGPVFRVPAARVPKSNKRYELPVSVDPLRETL